MDSIAGLDNDGPRSSVGSISTFLREAEEETEKCLLAKSYFDLREYYRAARVLKGCKGKRGIFLHYYSLYLAGEKRKEEERLEMGDRSVVINNELSGIREDLERLYGRDELDGFGLYLYALVLSRNGLNAIVDSKEQVGPADTDHHFANGDTAETSGYSKMSPSRLVLSPSFSPLSNAKDGFFGAGMGENIPSDSSRNQRLFGRHKYQIYCLSIYIKALWAYPWNWSAWVDFSLLIRDVNQLKKVEPLLPEHYFKHYWKAYMYLELQENQDALDQYEVLLRHFPHHMFILEQRAQALYNLRQLNQAEAVYEALVRMDPYRLSGLDVYSNILYVKGERAKLSYLAYKANATDKYTAETCCIIGNYYSLKNEREKAILYFKRALKINPRYLAAWTLIGHEYIELKNTPGAITAYRKAVDINYRDYRAWYSLGQTYELLQMPLYALYYFQRACQLRPHDARMWLALGDCYETINHTQNAILSYQRAEAQQFQDSLVYNKLAKLFERQGKPDQVAAYYLKSLHYLDQQHSETQDLADALLYLARYSKANGRINDAIKYASRLLEFKGEMEEAKALLRDINSRHSTSCNLPSQGYRT